MKKCSACKIEKPLDGFYKKHGKPKAQCKDCEKAAYKAGGYNRAFYQRHRARLLEEAKSRYWENPDKYRRKSVEWWANNATPEMRAAKVEYQTRYHQENPHVHSSVTARRRARQRQVEVEDFHRDEIYERDAGICQHCGTKRPRNSWHLDHIIPLALGGPHTRKNTRVLCRMCNQRKGDKLDVLCWHIPARPLLPPASG